LKYKLSKRASIDLVDIWIYSANKWSEKQADKYYNELIQAFENLANNVLKGQSADYAKIGYNILIVNPHILFFTNFESKEIIIMRILHKTMDTDRHL
jgi:toxin ParE1/3/4